MPTVNGPDEITTLTGGDDKVFFTDSDGNVQEVSIGATGTVLTSTGLTADPAFSALPADATVGANKAMYTNNSDVESGLAFGAAGTVLTSGGTDATATPPTWEAAAEGGVYTANSSAAITNGSVAVLDPAGTLSPVGTASAAGPPSTVAMSAGVVGGDAPSAQNSNFWDEDSNTLFTIATNSNSVKLIPSTVSWSGATPSMTQGASIAVTGMTSTFYNGAMGMYDKLNNKVVVAGRDYGYGNVKMQTGTVSGSGSSATISWDTVTVVTTYAPSYLWLTYMRSGPAYTAGATVGMICSVNSSGATEAMFFDPSGSSPVKMTTYYGMSAGTVGGQSVCDGSGNLKYPFIHNSFGQARWSSFYYGAGHMGSVIAPGMATWGSWIDMAWDENNNRGLIAVATSSSSSGNVYCWELTDSGAGTGAITGTDRNWASVSTNYMNVYNSGSCFWDVFSGKIMVWWVMSADRHAWMPVTLSGSGATTGTATATSGSDWSRSGQPYGSTLFHSYASGANLNFASGIFSGSSSAGSKNSYAISNAYLSTNEDAWLGVAKNTTTGSGQSQEVYVIGGVATEGLSGLTVGSNYYVQSSGLLSTVSTGGDRLVGKAIAADKILVENTGTGTA